MNHYSVDAHRKGLHEVQKMNRGFAVLLMSLMMMTTAMAGCLGGDEDADDAGPTTIKVGLLTPATGPIAVYSQGFEDAAALAIADLDSAHEDIEFELVVADSGCDATAASTAAQTLVDSGVVGIAGAACSGATLSAITVASAAGVPMVSYASTSPAVTTAEDDGYLFRVVPSDAQQAVALATVVGAEGMTSPAAVYMTNDYGSGLADNFEASWPTDLCAKIGYAQDETDFASVVQQLNDAGCDSVMLVSYATDGAAILEEMATQGVNASVFGADGIADAGFVDAFSDTTALNGVTATKPRPGADSAAKTTFEAAYAASGGDGAGIYTHETYDAVMMVGLAAAADSDGDLRDDLATLGTDYSGASGSHSFDAAGDVGGTGYEVCGFTNMADDTIFACPMVWSSAAGLGPAPFDGTVIKLGLLTPATGPIAVYSQGFEDAAAVAISALNLQGLANNVQFELVVADSGCDATAAATAAQTLVDSGVIGIAGAACSGATLSAITVAKEAGIPMISYASTSPAVTTADDNGLLFRVVPSDAQQALALVDVVSGDGHSNPGVLYMTNDYGSGLADNFEAGWDGDLCAKVGYAQDETDFSSAVQQINDAGCDSVMMVTYATDGAAILEEMSTQGMTLPIYGADGIADAGFIDAFSDNSSLDGVTATKPRPGTDSAEKAQFEAAYAAAGGDTSGIYTHETFDAVMMLGYAAMGTSEEVTLVQALMYLGQGVTGASGTHTFDENGDVGGTGYDVCSFSHDGSAASFSCDATWTAEGGVADNDA